MPTENPYEPPRLTEYEEQERIERTEDAESADYVDMDWASILVIALFGAILLFCIIFFE